MQPQPSLPGLYLVLPEHSPEGTGSFQLQGPLTWTWTGFSTDWFPGLSGMLGPWPAGTQEPGMERGSLPLPTSGRLTRTHVHCVHTQSSPYRWAHTQRQVHTDTVTTVHTKTGSHTLTHLPTYLCTQRQAYLHTHSLPHTFISSHTEIGCLLYTLTTPSPHSVIGSLPHTLTTHTHSPHTHRLTPHGHV